MAIVSYGLVRMNAQQFAVLELQEDKRLAFQVNSSALRILLGLVRAESITVGPGGITTTLPPNNLWSVQGGRLIVRNCNYNTEDGKKTDFAAVFSGEMAYRTNCSNPISTSIRVVDYGVAGPNALLESSIAINGETYVHRGIVELDKLAKPPVTPGNCALINFAAQTGTLTFNQPWPEYEYNLNADPSVPPFFTRPPGAGTITIDIGSAQFWNYVEVQGTSLFLVAGGVIDNTVAPAAWLPPGGAACPSVSCTQFTFHIEIQNANTPACTVISSPRNVYNRPPIGCFRGDTAIRMADGSERAVASLQPGDLVLDPVNNVLQEVARVVQGPEDQTLVQVSTDSGRELLVTWDHPVRLAHGEDIQAQQLQVGHELLAIDGHSTVLGVSRPAASVGTVVWNIEFHNEEAFGAPYVLANGIVTGALSLQNELREAADD